VEHLKRKHPSIPFNPDVANAFFRAGMIEAWGRGTVKIINDCRRVKIPVPSFKYDMSGFVVEFKKDINKQNTTDSVIALIIENEAITIAELAEKTGVVDMTIKRILKNLQVENKIIRIGSDRIGTWKVIIQEKK
jgi:ATP-dependent DNA helicase RecG